MIRVSHITCLSLICLLWGCRNNEQLSSLDTEMVAAERAKLLLDAEPEGALDVLQVRDLLGDPLESADHPPHGGEAHDEHATETPEDSDDATQADDDSDDHEQAHDEGHEHEDGHDHETHSQEVDEAAQQAIVVKGRIASAAPGGQTGDTEFPWHRGRAEFVITDASYVAHSHGDGHSHEGHDCPYSNIKLADAQAVVQFVGADGDPLPMDARELFELTGDEIVVIEGQAQLTAGLLMINGNGIFIRR